MDPDSRPALKVTVLVTLYNKGPFVEEAVRSLLANSFAGFELLVVDDGSTDGGPAIVRGIGDPRVRVVESAVNTGRAAAANRGYDLARGEYIAVLDADDIAHPERLARQVAFMDANPEVGACGSWMQAFGANDTLLRFPLSDRDARAIMLFGIPVSYGACMFRRSVIEEHHLRCDPTWKLPGMDYLFMLHVGFHTQYANLPEALASYRKGGQNMRHGRDPVQDARLLYRTIFDLFGLQVTDDEVDLHLFLYELDRSPPTAGQVRALFRWKNKLLRMNQERGAFPDPEFTAIVEKRWDRLFHTLVRCDARAAFAHMRCSGRVRERAGYLVRFTWRRWMGRPMT
ncbi:MAG: glycosyltransferase family 2 protein [Flavobacteriales bacterium]